jgi:hypothetical protein
VKGVKKVQNKVYGRNSRLSCQAIAWLLSPNNRLRLLLDAQPFTSLEIRFLAGFPQYSIEGLMLDGGTRVLTDDDKKLLRGECPLPDASPFVEACVNIPRLIRELTRNEPDFMPDFEISVGKPKAGRFRKYRIHPGKVIRKTECLHLGLSCKNAMVLATAENRGIGDGPLRYLALLGWVNDFGRLATATVTLWPERT